METKHPFGMKEKFYAVLKLTRIEHSIMLVIAVLAAEFIITKNIPLLPLILSLVSPIFISMAAFAINDYFDIKVDRLNGKMRPLVIGTIKPRSAIYITAISLAIGIIASALINPYCLLIAIIFGALAVSYSYKLKEMLLIGNAYVAFSMAIPFVFGNYVVSNTLYYSIAVISTMIFLSGLAREIHGTIRDYSGDIKIRGANTLPRAIGTGKASVVSAILYAIAILISVYLFLYVPPFSYNMPFALIVGISDILLAYVSVGYIYSGKRFYDIARNLSLAAMALALIAILIAPFTAGV